MPQTIKIATFNVEWMVNLFKPNKADLLTKQDKKTAGLGAKPKNPQGVADRIAAVIGSVDADIIGICEGPPLKKQMQTFVSQKLGNRYTVYSMEDGSQSVHALVRKGLRGVKVMQLSKTDRVYHRLAQVRTYFKFDNVRDAEQAKFTRMPVILRLTRKRKTTELMIVHTKSKISQLRKPNEWDKKDKAKVVSAIMSRQKLSVEMNVIRKYIANRLYSGGAEGIIVMGDMNDGIARDIVDESYLLHSIIHELRGAFHHELALMRHVLTGKQIQRKKYAWTVEFRDATAGGKKSRVLLDHIIFSPACYNGGKICYVKNSGKIEHEAYDAQVSKRGDSRDVRPSDHKPLSALFVLR